VAENFGDGGKRSVSFCYQQVIEKPEPVMFSGRETQSEVRRSSEMEGLAAQVL
jgi:hypothetical protein